MANYTQKEALEFVAENDVKFIRLAFCDFFGNQKNISIMPEELPRAFADGINFDSFLILGYDDPVYQDLFLRPDPSTLHILPWRPQQGCVIRFYCDVILPNGEPFPYCPRKFLKDTLAECKKEGFLPRVGLRSEFYLFKTDEEGNPTNIPWDNGGYLDVAPLDKGENIRREICLCLEEMGIQPETSHHEAGPGQNEIDFYAADALKTADYFVTYKNVVSNIAARNGMHASFEPKPIPGESGNGLHMKVGLFNGVENIEESRPEIFSSFMAGVLHWMRDITVFLNTKEESYLRFGQKEAPKHVTWSTQNRSRLLRVPLIAGKRSYFVLRSPDSAINPYLAFAMVVRAGLWGVRNKAELPEPVDRSSRLVPDTEKKNYDRLPESISEAVECAGNSKLVHEEDIFPVADRFLQTIAKKQLNMHNDR